MRARGTTLVAIVLMIAPVALTHRIATGAAMDDSRSEVREDRRQGLMVQRWLRVWNEGDPAALDSLVADRFILNGKPVGRAHIRQVALQWRSHPQRLEVDAQALVSEGRVVGIWYWTQDPAVSDSTSAADPGLRWVGADFLRVQGDSLVEGWVVNDRLGLLEAQ